MAILDINPNTIVVQTAAQWAVDATIYSGRTILITSDVFFTGTDQRKFKIADGVQTWAQLDYFPDAIAQLIIHTSNTSNPHNTTLEQARSQNNQIAGNIDANNNKVINLVTPTSNGDSANKQYVDNQISAAVVGLLDDRGNYNASSNIFPSTGGSGTAGAILKGDLWTISVAGTLGGVSVTSGDVVRALVDTPGQTASNWVVTENNIGYVPENNSNKVSTIVSSATQFPNNNAVIAYAAPLASQLKATTVKTGAYNAQPGDYIPCDTTSGVVPITLPTAPSDGTIIAIKRVIGASNNVTYATGGSDVLNVSGGSTSGSLQILNQQVTLIYRATGGIWYVETSISLGGLDARYLSISATRKYALRFSFSSFGPASSNTYFFGDLADLIPNTSSVARFRIETPVSGIINRLRITGNFSAGTGQSATWQIRNVTTNTIVVLTSSFSFASAGNLPVVFTSVGLAVSAGDELEMQLVTPSWVTPPTVLRVTCHAAVDVT